MFLENVILDELEELKFGNSCSLKKYYKLKIDGKYKNKKDKFEKLVIDFSESNHQNYEVLIIDNSKFKYQSELDKFVWFNAYLVSNIGNVPKIYEYTDTKLVIDDVGRDVLINISLNKSDHRLVQKVIKDSIDWLVKLYYLPLDERICKRVYEQQAILKELSNFSSEFSFQDAVQPLVEYIFQNVKQKMIHRDFQSGNIIYHEETRETYIIDYQDMCLGLEYYDLVSLLFDVKLCLSDKEIEYWIDYYSKQVGKLVDRISIYLMAVIRICKSLSFRLKNTEKYKKEIKRGYYLLKRLEHKLELLSTKYDILFNIIYRIINVDRNELTTNLNCCILAAGKGSRMNTEDEKPKVLVKYLKNFFVEYPLRMSELLGADKIHIIVGYQYNKVISNIHGEINFTIQEPQLGTGHAVMMLQNENKLCNSSEDVLLVLMGDCCLINYYDLNKFVEMFMKNLDYKSGILTTSLDIDKQNSGSRIIRDENGEFIGSMEYKDILYIKNEKKRENLLKIKETGTGICIFREEELVRRLKELKNDNIQKEYYLPDIINLQLKDNEKVLCYKSKYLIKGANSQDELKQL